VSLFHYISIVSILVYDLDSGFKIHCSSCRLRLTINEGLGLVGQIFGCHDHYPIAPAAMGISLLITLVIIPRIAPAPLPLEVCLRGHNVDTFSIHPTVDVLVDGNLKQLPSGVGNETVNGTECLRPIHTDAQGNTIHIEYVRPIRLTLGDFMKIYSPDNYSYYG
jgi:hypothetical protein